MTQYFDGEKTAGLLFAIIGLLGAIGACVLFPSRWEQRAFAITLLVWALLEMAIGVGLFIKTGPQVARLAAQLSETSAAFYTSEAQRMAIVQRNFVVIEVVWLTLIAGSSATAWLFRSRASVSGIALGILINASFFLAFDIIAERRGATYFAELQREKSARGL